MHRSRQIVIVVTIIRPRRSRSAAAYSRQIFPWTICRPVGPYVRTCVGRSVGLSSALWKNGGSDPDAVCHRRSDGSRDEAGSWVWGSVHGKGYFWVEFGAHHCNQWGLYGVCVRQRRDAALFPNYFGQACYIQLLSALSMIRWGFDDHMMSHCSPLTPHSTHSGRSFRRRLFPGNQLHWCMTSLISVLLQIRLGEHWSRLCTRNVRSCCATACHIWRRWVVSLQARNL